MKGFFHQMWTSFPDIRVDLLRIAEDDDLFAAQFRVGGTHEGEFMGAPPTGNRIELEAMTFMRFGSAGTVVERWTRMDEIALLMQFGLLPAPAGAPA